MTISSVLYKYGNHIIRKLRNSRLERLLRKHRMRFITREINLSNGISFLLTLNLQDRGLSQQLLTNDWREYDSTLYLIDSFLGTDEVVVDIGANIGYFVLIEASYDAGNYVYAIEPVPENHSILAANIQLNGLQNVVSYEMGISNTCESREMIVPRHLNWSTLNAELFEQFEMSDKGSRRVRVDLLTLSEFEKLYMEKKPTMVRMDVEGFEYEILTGNSAFLEKHQPKLFIEFHTNLLGRERSLEVLRLLEQAGYEIEMYITNLEYCGHDLVFPAPKGSRIKRYIAISEYIHEISQRSDAEVREGEGCMLFLRNAS